MTNEETIFTEALAKGSVPEREAYLDQACAGNAGLRGGVESLLLAHQRAGGVLETPPVAVDLTRASPPFTDGVGAVVGPYKLLEQIGEGGMAVVFLAEQSRPIQRRVALKIIKPGMDSRMVAARFDAERQALALMDHANIAKVLEAGTTGSGRPYFVMELVKGVPITRYCDERHLPPRERLELFVDVCSAVQHAHQKGIIHRDLKPSNVLVALYDGKPVPKVIDFGIAKAVGQPLTERTLFTSFGSVVGTPEYMSPEQAELNQLDVDTRSDIYSLGVLLYELLAGSTPLEHNRFKAAALMEMLRVVREEEPPNPSTRLSTSEQLPSIAANRGLEPKKLSGLIHGELDWIVMKALEKDRARRYETANGLAKDVERYLADEPVQAAKPSRRYRLQKFVRRNKRPVVAVAAVVLALVVGFVLTTVGFVQASRQRAIALTNETKARTEAAKATAVSGFLQEMLESANPEQAEADYSVRQLLDDFSAGLGNQLATQPEVEAEVRLTIGRAYRRLRVADRAESNLQIALDLSRRAFGPEHEKVAEILIDCGWNLANQKRGVEAEKAIQEALRIYRVRGIRGQAYVRGLWILQRALVSAGRNAESDAVTQEALAVADASPGIEFPDLASILHQHAVVWYGRQQYATAEQWARRGVEMHRRLNGDEHPETAWGLKILGRALLAQGKLAEAESAQREALSIFRKRFGDAHEHTTLGVLTQLKQTLKAAGKTSELEALTLELLESARKTENRKEADDWFKRGQARAARRQWDVAAVAYNEAIELTGGIGAASGTGRQLVEAGQAAAESGRRDAAIRLLGFAARILEQDVAADPAQFPARRDLSICYQALHEALWSEQRVKESAEVARKDVQLLDRGLIDSPGNGPWFLGKQGHSYGYLGYRLWALREYAAARDAFAGSSDVFRRCIERHAPDRKAFFLLGRGKAVRNISQIWEAEGRTDEAQTAWREALGYYELILNEPLANIDAGWINEYHSDFAHVLEKVGTAEDALRIGPKLRPPGSELNPQGLAGLGACQLQIAGLLHRGGRAQEAEGAYRGVVDLYTRLAADSSDNPGMFWRSVSASHELGKILQATGQSAEAIEVCLRAAERCHSMTAQYEKIAPDRNSSGDCWSFAIQYESVGQLLSDLGRDKEGEAAYRDAQRVWIKLVAAFNIEDHRWHLAVNYDQLGHLLKKMGRFDEAADSYRQALAIWQKLAVETASEDRRMHLTWSTGWLARLLEKQGKFAEAEALCRETVRLIPDSSPAHLKLGGCLFRQGKVVDAQAEFDQAIRLDPNSASTLNSIAWFLATSPQSQQADHARAVQLAERGVNLAPKDGNLWNTLGVARYRNGEWKDAITALEKSMELRAGGNSFDWFFLAMSHWQLGDKAAARNWHDQAVVWLEKNRPKDEELLRFHTEASELLKLNDRTPATTPKSE